MTIKELSHEPLERIKWIRNGIILNELDDLIFNLALHDKSIVEISQTVSVSERTVSYRKKSIEGKINRLLEYCELKA